MPPKYTHRKSPADTLMDLLRTGDNGPDNVNVLCGFLQPVQLSGKGFGGHAESRIRRTNTVGTFHIEGLDCNVERMNHDGIRHGLLSSTILKWKLIINQKHSSLPIHSVLE